MEFEVTEIKALGTRTCGFTVGPESLSLRLEAIDAHSTQTRKFTIHAVVPFSPEFSNVQVGQKFKFERFETEFKNADGFHKASLGNESPAIVHVERIAK